MLSSARLALAVVAAALCAAAPADAQLIKFSNNSGAFTWRVHPGSDDEGLYEWNWLDVTKPASAQQQPEFYPPSIPNGVYLTNDWLLNLYRPFGYQLRGAPGGARFAAGDPVVLPPSDDVEGDTITRTPPRVQLPSMATVGPADSFEEVVWLAHRQDVHGFLAPDQWLVDLSDPKIIGLEIVIDGQIHYAFIEMMFQSGSPTNPFSGEFIALRWGYEATPGASVFIPAPGAAALLCSAVLGAWRRRR